MFDFIWRVKNRIHFFYWLLIKSTSLLCCLTEISAFRFHHYTWTCCNMIPKFTCCVRIFILSVENLLRWWNLSLFSLNNRTVGLMLIAHVTKRPMNKWSMFSFGLFERPFTNNINFFDNLTDWYFINVKLYLIIFFCIFVVNNDILLISRILLYGKKDTWIYLIFF